MVLFAPFCCTPRDHVEESTIDFNEEVVLHAFSDLLEIIHLARIPMALDIEETLIFHYD